MTLRIPALALAFTFVGCGGIEQTALPQNQRLISVQITPEDASKLSLQSVALQLAAVSVDARLDSPVLDFQASNPISPNANAGAPVRMDLTLPMDGSYLIYIQVPIDGRKGLGKMVARLRFPTGQADAWSGLLSGRSAGVTTALSDLDLGILSLVSTNTGDDSSRDIVIELGDGTSENPLSINDSDADGTPDFDDADDDNDFIPDTVDEDANGDGIPDQQQSYEALLRFDTDGDQVPDIFQP